jgi:hypothetical protein
MATTADRIVVAPDSEVAQLVKRASAARVPLEVDTGDGLYRVQVWPTLDHEQPTPGPDGRPTPEQVESSREGIRKAAGGWVGLVDAEAFKAYIRERRKIPGRRHNPW